MWIIFGLSAIVTAYLNLYCWSKGREAKWFRFLSLSLTTLTLCANYSHDAQWVLKEDWSALMDVVPSMSQYLWVMTVGSIALNGITLLPRK